jgi:hypothetical protein
MTHYTYYEFKNQDKSLVGGSSPGKGWESFSSSPRSDRLCGPTSLLSNGYQGLFPWG